MNSISETVSSDSQISFEFLTKLITSLLIVNDYDNDTQKEIIESIPKMEIEDVVDLAAALEAKF